AYIRLNVEIDDFLPVEAKAEAATLTNGKQCRLCHINALRRTISKNDGHQLSVQEFKETDPLEIAKRFAADTGIEFDDDLKQMFDEAVRMVREEERSA
ncbi:MAG: exonuclease SbcCD subunit D C-terminal domain-containing protein, partial [Muribaculaceae bacterium]|nr:exonuclease SbcCD subunit D C-terminal domain-containing protein [Muribaculaceae bacterium]